MGVLNNSRIAIQVVILALLGACAGGGGGGGGGGGVVSPPPPPPPPATGTPRPPAAPIPSLPPAAAPGSFPAPTSQEFLNNWGPGGIRAQTAWQFQNAHGEGVLIGVIDDGVDPNHPELVGRIDPRSVDIVGSRNQLTSSLSHGSELSSLMVGNFNGIQTVGVAFEATVLAVRADSGSSSFSDANIAAAIDYAVAQGVKVINFSLGGPNPTSSGLRAAMERATDAGVILVFSAGNDGSTQPNFPAQLATDAGVSNGLILVAGGSNPDGTFNPTSNRAGSAQNSYLVAPGWQILVPDHGPPGAVPGFQTCGLGPNGDLCRIQGTSYASPHVAAAIAVLWSTFPGLTPAQVMQLVLQTTDDMGVAGIDATTGWGHLNLERAFAPFGTVAAPLAYGTLSVGPSTPLGAVGAAFGDGVIRHTAAWNFASFDSFGRTYNFDYSDNWSAARAGPAGIVYAPSLWRSERTAQGLSVQMALAEDVAPESYRTSIDRAELQQDAMRIDASLGAGLTLSFAAHGASTLEQPTNDPIGHLGLVNADTSIRLTRQIGDMWSISVVTESGEEHVGLTGDLSERSAAAGRASLELGRFGLSVTAGRISEGTGVLGLVWADSLGDMPGGETQFTGLSGHFDPGGGWRLSFDTEYGVAELSQSGWLDVVEPLRTSAFSLEASRSYTPFWLNPFGVDGSGVLSLTLSQPLRVEDGVISFVAPTATNYGRRSLQYETRSIEPTPSGREMRLGLGYRYFAGDVFSAFGEVLYVTEPGHVENADPEGMARFGFRLRR